MYIHVFTDGYFSAHKKEVKKQKGDVIEMNMYKCTFSTCNALDSFGMGSTEHTLFEK